MRTGDVRVPLDGAPFPGRWRLQGACRDVPTSVFFPPRGASLEPAKEVCRVCPVRAQCIDYALPLSDLKGVWGGLAERDRKRRRRAATARAAATAPVVSTGRRPRRVGDLYATLEELTASPGQWARVALYPAPYTGAGMAGRLRSGTLAAPAGIWQFEGRETDGGGSGLWARYEPADAASASSNKREAS